MGQLVSTTPYCKSVRFPGLLISPCFVLFLFFSSSFALRLFLFSYLSAIQSLPHYIPLHSSRADCSCVYVAGARVCVCTVRWTQYACVLYSFVLVVCTTPTVSINKEDELQHLSLLYTRENYPADHTGTRGRQKKRKTKKKDVEETKAEDRCNK